MDKKKSNTAIGKALRTKRTELGGATAGPNGSGAAVNITKQLGYKNTVSVYELEKGNTTLSVVDFVLYCKAMQLSEKEIAEFFEQTILKLIV